MKAIIAIALLFCVAIVAKPFEEFVLFSPEKMPSSGAYPGMGNELVPSPEKPEAHALKVVYKEYKQKGDAEWPSIYFTKPNFNGIALEGWDAFAFSVYNPYNEKVDLGICIDGPKKRFTKHILLEPCSWNHRMLHVDVFQNTIGDSIVKFDLFMTRPTKTYTLFYERIALVKRNLPDDMPIAKDYPLVEFDKPLSLCKPFMHHTLIDPKLGFDWSPFAALSVTTAATGGVAPVTVAITDAFGNHYKQEFLQNPGTESTWKIPFHTTDLKSNCIKQLCVSSSTRGESEVTLKAVRLHTPRKEDIEQMKAPLLEIKRLIDSIPAERRGTFPQEYKELTDKFTQGERAAMSPVTTLGNLRRLVVQEKEAQKWLVDTGRFLHEESIVAQTEKAFPDAPFGIAIADSMTKVMIKDLPLKDVEFTKQIQLEMAKNEYESTQIVLIGKRESTASVVVGPLKNGDVTLPPEAVCVGLVGHVKCEKPPYEASYQGWWPDPILDFQKSARIAPHEAVSFWLRFKTSKETKPGIYHGNVQILADGKTVASLPLTLRMFDFALEDKSPLDIATDFRDHIRQVWGNDISQERYNQIFNQIVDVFAEYKINFDRIYRGTKRGDPKSLNLPVEALKRLRDRGQLRCFNIMQIQTPRDCLALDDPRVQQEIDHVLNVLDYWVPILEKESLMKYAYLYGYDEFFPNAFPVIAKIYKAIKAKYPQIPMATTAYDHSFGLETCLGDAVDIFTPLTPRYEMDAVSRSRQKGHKIWWYICISPKSPYANWFIEYDAIETRLLMGAMTAKYRPDGFLYYALTRWPVNKKPIDGGPYTDWNPASYKTANGDGSIFCAGPDGVLGTIRAENFRDGLEDYAYVLELEKRTGKKVAIPDELVTSMTQYTRNPKVVREFRRKLAEAIMAAKQ